MTTSGQNLDEFTLIEHYFRNGTQERTDVILGIGDDAAIVRVPDDQDVVVTMDTLISGVHFPDDTSPSDIGYKAIAVNLSDLAAMGAVPSWASLALSIPHLDSAWLSEFCRGFFELANAHNVQLIGGDMTRGPLSMTIQVHGLVPRGQALRRSGAQLGDDIYVTGPLGIAALGLQWLQGHLATALPDALMQSCLERLHRPLPRVECGQQLRTLATSAIDVSDGLVADLGHILRASGVGADIELSRIPGPHDLFPDLAAETAWQLALAGGDDYELCFTASRKHETELAAMASDCRNHYTRIGTIVAQSGLRIYQPDGKLFQPSNGGYRHF